MSHNVNNEQVVCRGLTKDAWNIRVPVLTALGVRASSPRRSRRPARLSEEKSYVSILFYSLQFSILLDLSLRVFYFQLKACSFHNLVSRCSHKANFRNGNQVRSQGLRKGLHRSK